MKYLDSYWIDVDRVITHIPNVETLKGKTVLITGASGMLCSPVVDVLVRLNQIGEYSINIVLAGRNLDRLKKRFSDIEDGTIRYIGFDLEDDEKLQADADYYIHGAAVANPADYATKPVEILYGTIRGVKKVLEACRHKQGSRILYISSSEVYGFRKENSMEPYSEDECNSLDILDVRSCYPQAKRTAESLCAMYVSEYDLDAVIARPGHVYGPTVRETDGRASAVFAINAKREGCVKMKGAGNQLRSYCYILDCASAVLTIMLNGEKGEAYNVSNPGSIVTIRELADGFAEAVGGKIFIDDPSEIEKKGFTKMTNSSLKSDKLEALGWQGEFDIKEGTKKTIELM